MKKLKLLIEAAKNFKTVGTISFSSKFLVQKIIKPIDFEQANCIVELGAGNGCITKALLSKMQTNSKLLSFEVNDAFIEMLQPIVDSRLHLIHDSAEKMGVYLAKNGEEQADFIVSSVPLLVLPKQISQRILEQVSQYLKPNGLFIQLSYSAFTHNKFKDKFASVKRKFTPLNLPPAFVFVCQKEASPSTDNHKFAVAGLF